MSKVPTELEILEKKLKAIENVLENPLIRGPLVEELEAQYKADREFYEKKFTGLEREWIHLKRDLEDKDLDLTNKKLADKVKQLEKDNLDNQAYYSRKIYEMESTLDAKNYKASLEWEVKWQIECACEELSKKLGREISLVEGSFTIDENKKKDEDEQRVTKKDNDLRG